jgi:hypothetical protein
VGRVDGQKLHLKRLILVQVEEEEYADVIVRYFDNGLLSIEDGTLLRAHISDALG